MVLASNLPRAIWHFCTLPKFIFICTAATAQNCTQCQCICNANCAQCSLLTVSIYLQCTAANALHNVHCVLCSVHSTAHSINVSAMHCTALRCINALQCSSDTSSALKHIDTALKQALHETAFLLKPTQLNFQSNNIAMQQSADEFHILKAHLLTRPSISKEILLCRARYL